MYIPQIKACFTEPALLSTHKILYLINYKNFSNHSLCCADLRLVVVTHQYAVEELVHTKAQDTHHQVDDVVHEPKVGQHLPRLLGERALVPHHTYQIYTFIYHLPKKKPVLSLCCIM